MVIWAMTCHLGAFRFNSRDTLHNCCRHESPYAQLQSSCRYSEGLALSIAVPRARKYRTRAQELSRKAVPKVRVHFITSAFAASCI